MPARGVGQLDLFALGPAYLVHGGREQLHHMEPVHRLRGVLEGLADDSTEAISDTGGVRSGLRTDVYSGFFQISEVIIQWDRLRSRLFFEFFRATIHRPQQLL